MTLKPVKNHALPTVPLSSKERFKGEIFLVKSQTFEAQCRNFSFISIMFYMKSILGRLKVRNQPVFLEALNCDFYIYFFHTF